MNPYTSVNNFTSEDAFLINQREKAAIYDMNLQNFSEEVITRESEKIHYDSQTFEKEIICKIYDPYRDDFITINAVAYNINNNGLVFRTNRPLEIGDPISIRAKKTKNVLSKQHDNELDEGVHAQIIWCNKTFNQEHNLCYEVGVAYFD